MLTRIISLVVFFVMSTTTYAGVFGLQPYYRPGQNPKNIVGVRYKMRVNQNIFVSMGKIIFNAIPLYTPGQPLDLISIQTNFFSYSFRLPEKYMDLGCATSRPYGLPDGGNIISGQSSIVPSIGDWLFKNSDYSGRQGLKSYEQTLFPSLTSTIDGIDGFTSNAAPSQFDITGKDIFLEVTRGETFTMPLSGWGAHFLLVNDTKTCTDKLQPNTLYRIWHLTLTIDGKAYRFDVAALDNRAQYIRSDWTISLRTEFFEGNGYFQAFYWDFEILQENSPTWTRLNVWTMPEYHAPNCFGHSDDLSCFSDSSKPLKFFYGPKFAIHDGKYVLEISNDDTDTYFHKNDVFPFPTSPAVSSLAVINWAQPALTVLESQGTANLIVNLDRPTPVYITASFSIRQGSRPEVHRLLTIPPGSSQEIYSLSIANDLGIVNDKIRQPDRRFDVVFDSSSTAVFGSENKITLTVTDDDTANSPPTAPTIYSAPGIACKTLSINWRQATDDSGPIAAYKLYRNGVFIKEVDGDILDVIDHVPNSGKFRYEVSAVDPFGLESPRSAPMTTSPPGVCILF